MRKICQECSRPFVPLRRSDAFLCSAACKQKGVRRRVREADASLAAEAAAAAALLERLAR